MRDKWAEKATARPQPVGKGCWREHCIEDQGAEFYQPRSTRIFTKPDRRVPPKAELVARAAAALQVRLRDRRGPGHPPKRVFGAPDFPSLFRAPFVCFVCLVVKPLTGLDCADRRLLPLRASVPSCEKSEETTQCKSCNITATRSRNAGKCKCRASQRISWETSS